MTDPTPLAERLRNDAGYLAALCHSNGIRGEHVEHVESIVYRLRSTAAILTRRTNLTYYRRKAAKQCPECGEPYEGPYIHCDDCRKWHARRMREARKR